MHFEQNMSQQQKQVQKLAMTQQLQQSIQMLQYNSEELAAFIQQKALENPLVDMANITVSDEVEGVYRKKTKAATVVTSSDEKQKLLNQIPNQHLSLFEYLLAQIHLSMRDTYLRELVLFLTEYIDNKGFLKITEEAAMAQTGATYLQILDAVTLLQQLEPAGVGAHDLQECLLLQIERDDTSPNMAYIILEEEFENFAMRKWEKLTKKYGISLKEIQKIFDYVQTLSPNPGIGFQNNEAEYISPDLIVRIENGELTLNATKRSYPKINFQQQYFDKMLKVADIEVTKYIKEKKQEFDWLAKNIQQRGDTILNIGQTIIRKQKDFFFNPAHPLKPMTLKEIAEFLGVHESTVSRGVNGKYMQTPFGIYELRSFFSTGVPAQNSEEQISNANIKQMIATLIASENKSQPLADQKIVVLLADKGIEISRRTVAKYREQLGIQASSKRKRYE